MGNQIQELTEYAIFYTHWAINSTWCDKTRNIGIGKGFDWGEVAGIGWSGELGNTIN